MKIPGIGGIAVAAAVMAVFPLGNNLSAKPSTSVEAKINQKRAKSPAPADARSDSSAHDVSAVPGDAVAASTPETQQPNSESDFSIQENEQTGLQGDSSLKADQITKFDEHEDDFSVRDYLPDNLSLHPYIALPAEGKPAEIILNTLKGVPIGTPLEEIKRASAAFGLDFNFMRTIAKIESDFDPNQRTGSYIGLFQLDRQEFAIYGSGDITNPRDNAVAAASKFATEARLFELDTHKKPTFSDLYLIHQQGWRGAAEHVSQPERVAWKSLCATEEGQEKGEKWCKRAIWQNTLPTVKHIWKSVDNLTSGAFVDMWREQVDRLYARYSEGVADGSDD